VQDKPWALIDADDTLIAAIVNGSVVSVHSAYSHCINEFCLRMIKLGFNEVEARDTQQEVDRYLCIKYGFAKMERFPRSFKDAYRLLCSRHNLNHDTHVATEVERIGWQVFREFKYVAISGALEVLRIISMGFRVAIITKGPEEHQRKKVAESGCSVFAQEVIVMAHKSLDEWQERVVLPLQIHPELKASSFVIGDSVKSEVNPALALGFNAIHIVNPDIWTFENEPYLEVQNGQQLIVARHIREVIDHLNLSHHLGSR